MNLIERIWSKTTRGGPDECWPWNGDLGSKGHPQIGTCINGKKGTKSVRRLVWAHVTNSTPSKQRWVRTTCGNTICVNPKHLALRTVLDDPGRFWEHVDKGDGSGCWIWTGWKQKGYGLICIDRGTLVFAHRYSYELAHGPIEGHVPGDPERERVVMHTCDNPPCVNPAHLRLGTDKDNMQDMLAKGRAAWQKARASVPTGGEGEPR